MGPGGPLEVLQSYKEQGVIGHIGMSGGPIDMLIRYIETGLFSAVETHNRYTLINRSADPLLDLCADGRGRSQRGAVRQRHFGQGAGRLRPLCLSRRTG
ncbi:MAG: hypothetical protein R2911_26920 [Caldilineaceae bacterium]